MTVFASTLDQSAWMNPSPKPESPAPHVNRGGASGAMQKGDLGSKANLMDHAHLPHFYAIRPVERMGGEATVFDSHLAVATIPEGAFMSPTRGARSRLSRYTAGRRAINRPDRVRNPVDREPDVAEAAQLHGIDTNKPFASQVRAEAAKLNSHVFDSRKTPRPGKTPLTGYKTNWQVVDEPIDSLGFYPTVHQGWAALPAHGFTST